MTSYIGEPNAGLSCVKPSIDRSGLAEWQSRQSRSRTSNVARKQQRGPNRPRCNSWPTWSVRYAIQLTLRMSPCCRNARCMLKAFCSVCGT